ncbi:MAG: PilZ domain-containing protein, partial [Candidatus Omnitrophica bacterium]|nr:PilZ domain-containing protein [Candidatus Omnitrophota bacterium]
GGERHLKLSLIIISALFLVLLMYVKIQGHLENLIIPSPASLKRKKSFKEERRRHIRRNARLRIRYQTPSGDGIGWLKNISQGGACLLFMNALKAGTPLHLEIDLPYDKDPVVAETRSVWSKGDNVGLVFDSVDRADLNRVFQFIDNKQRFLETVHS